MLLTACMIVKNEEEMLKRTLPNLQKGADEIILVDTGSVDNTVKIAEEYGCKVFHFKWIDDFSAARNESLKHAGGDWIIWIDADEFINEDEWNLMRKTLVTAEKDAYDLEIRECLPGQLDYNRSYPRVKIFKNQANIHFEREINEQLFDGSNKLLEAETMPGVHIYHWGARLEGEKKNVKKERNIRIFSEQIKKHPTDPYFRYLLASNYKDDLNFGSALQEYDKLISLDPPKEILSAALADKAYCLYRLKNAKDAYSAAKLAVSIDEYNASAWSLIGLIMGSAKLYKEALEILNNAQNMDIGRSISINKSLRGHEYAPYYSKGLIYEMMGEKDLAVEAYCKALAFEETEEVIARLEAISHGN